MKAVMYLTIAMRQFVTFGGRILRRERKGFFTDFFFKIYITIIFQEISDVVSALRFLPVTDLDPQATT